ncbi:MAG: DUF4982 domain-containing protein [Chitinispirillaceae bacterium]|nr:DUF4982 domain-containing protein [Chitinispirillaceae bacterium]
MHHGMVVIRLSLVAVVFSTFFSTTAFSQQFSLPQTKREKIKIDTSWKFYRGDVTGAQAATFNDQSWSTVHLPHTFSTQSSLGGSPYRGIGWYRKHITLNPAYQGRKITVYFEGAATVSQVWINGTSLPTHHGGYNPFCYEISQYCKFDGSENIIAMKLDNTYQKDTPPEKPNGSGLDYNIYGGIYRNVYLIVSDNVYIPEAVHDWSNSFAAQGGQFITYPRVSAASATINIESWIKNTTAAAASCKLVVTLVDKNNAVVQSGEITVTAAANGVTKASQTLTVANPNLWFPWKTYMYSLYTVVYNGTTPVDYYRTKIGIRKLTFTKTSGVYCNDQSFKILGLNRHQTWPYVGAAVPNIQQVRDAVLLHEGGCNFVRCSHYLQDDAFFDACDSLGLLSWVEIPAWASGFTPQASMQPFTDRCIEANRSNIRVGRNHPSIAIWGAGLNEGWQSTAWEQIMHDAAKKEDTTRPTTQSRNYAVSNNVFDLYGGNWFTDVPASNPDPSTLGFLLSEHTGHTFPTGRTDAETRLVEHAGKHEYMNSGCRVASKTWIHGNVGWCAFDYNSGGGIQPHGAMDLMHIPKFCYYFYKSQSAGDNYDGKIHPMVYIANYYKSNSPLDRLVFTNCEQVRLYKNGTLVGTKTPSGNNCAHPSITFSNVSFEAGELKAEGLIGGQVVATHVVKTPGTPAKITLTTDPDTIEANGSDFSRVIAAVVDNNGTVVPTATNSISFSISGSGGSLIGQNPVNAIGGYHIILARAGLIPGTLNVSATSGSMTSNRVSIVALPMNANTDIILHSSFADKPIHPSECIKKVVGGRLVLPASASPQAFSVFDLTGKCVHSGVARGGIIDLRSKEKVARISIVRIEKGINR